MAVAQMSLEEGLQEYFGFNKFKGNQEKIIKSLMGGHYHFATYCLNEKPG